MGRVPIPSGQVPMPRCARTGTKSASIKRFRVNGATKTPASRKRPLFDLPRLRDAIVQASFFLRTLEWRRNSNHSHQFVDLIHWNTQE